MSLYGKACASLITLLADYQIGPFFKTLLVMFLDESSIVAYFATQHAHYLSTLIANLLISRSTFLLNALLHAFLLCSIALYIILNSVELQETYILSFNLFFHFNTLFSFVLIVCRLLDFLEHFVGFSTQGVILGKAWPATSWEKCQGLDQQYM